MRPGIDYPLKCSPSRKTRLRLRDNLIECLCHHEYGLTYQKCRFCERGWPDLRALLKYAVRHYICEDCRAYFLQLPPASLRS